MGVHVCIYMRGSGCHRMVWCNEIELEPNRMTKTCSIQAVCKGSLCMGRYELFVDELPVWGFVGPPPEEAKDEKQIYIYAHKSFDINYNENRARPAACGGTLRARDLLLCMPNSATHMSPVARSYGVCTPTVYGHLHTHPGQPDV